MKWCVALCATRGFCFRLCLAISGRTTYLLVLSELYLSGLIHFFAVGGKNNVAGDRETLYMVSLYRLQLFRNQVIGRCT